MAYAMSIEDPKQRNVYNTIMNDFIHDPDRCLLVISKFSQISLNKGAELQDCYVLLMLH